MSNDRRAPLPTTRFRPQKTHFIAVVFLLFLAVLAMGFTLWFTPLLLVPLIYSAWILRVRTTVSDRGITAVYLVSRRRSLPWDRFRGLQFDKQGRGYAVSTDDERFALPSITFNSLPALSDATNGRIPDPVTPARLADEEMVEVFDAEGRSRKMTREEYAEYERRRRRAEHEAERDTRDDSADR